MKRTENLEQRELCDGNTVSLFYITASRHVLSSIDETDATVYSRSATV